MNQILCKSVWFVRGEYLLMKKLREKLDKFFQGRYGQDDLGKAILIFSLLTYVLGVVIQNKLILLLSVMELIIVLYRALSRQYWNRSEENIRYMSYIKLWKLRYENRKHSRIFICKRCGRYIRVPKGKGKIQVTCTVCGGKTIHYT